VATFHFGGGQSLIPAATTNCRKVEKGTFCNSNFVQLRKEGGKKFFAKAGSNSASEF
jgi:hypothetical protein